MFNIMMAEKIREQWRHFYTRATPGQWGDNEKDWDGDGAGGYSLLLPDGGRIFISRRIERGQPSIGQSQDKNDCEFISFAHNGNIGEQFDLCLMEIKRLTDLLLESREKIGEDYDHNQPFNP